MRLIASQVNELRGEVVTLPRCRCCVGRTARKVIIEVESIDHVGTTARRSVLGWQHCRKATILVDNTVKTSQMDLAALQITIRVIDWDGSTGRECHLGHLSAVIDK
ncbi:hypothetical protein E2C01_056519 [Portunus trituberculatus]|uniref:Uncharacterized protein n=1 Tax=Portunus trituberculatus TaxID=210409 RepID=A0A5B7H0R6_PORTR|nr:hypothetical protein [Portunus trituberculatus]